MNTYKYISAILTLCFTITFAQQTPAPAQTEAFTIVGAIAHIGDGTVIEQSVIIVENGKITACVNQLTSKLVYKGTIIDAKGKHVYPGFIGANTSLGLVEINAVRASNDQDEIGQMIPHIRSLIAYNAESKVIESMRPNGVLLAQVSPRGGRISGTSSIMQLDAWNWEDAALKVDDGIHLNWPNNFTRGRWWLGEPRGLKLNKDYTKQIEEINAFVKESKAHLKGKRATKNLPFEAMEGLFNGSQKLYVRVNDEKGITDAVFFAKNNGIEHLVIIGGYQAHLVTNLLKNNNVSVLINNTHSLPSLEDNDYDLPYKNPKLLADAGVLVGIQGHNSNFQTRNLPFYAGQVVGQGMDKEEALKLITSNTAKILGIDADYGTLEAGKSATLFISEGDALDMRTNILTHAFIDGRTISLESHQTTLWKRYSNKYKGE
ncbi:amidohydrolase family protein [Flavobacteriaceae bacterium AH-315-B10]|nr:amidohydrolase family protein [Flavobacteriaceae bacterium AH-315-B10]